MPGGGECEREFLLYAPFLLFPLDFEACEHIIYSKSIIF